MQSGAVIMQPNLSWYCIQHCDDCGRKRIRFYNHNTHPIVSIVMILEKMDQVITAPHCILSASIGCCNKKGFFITCGIIMRDGLLGDRFLFGTNNSCSNQAGAIIESAPGKLGIWCEYTNACYTMLSMELRYNSMNDRLTVFILKVTHLLWKG